MEIPVYLTNGKGLYEWVSLAGSVVVPLVAFYLGSLVTRRNLDIQIANQREQVDIQIAHQRRQEYNRLMVQKGEEYVLNVQAFYKLVEPVIEVNGSNRFHVVYDKIASELHTYDSTIDILFTLYFSHIDTPKYIGICEAVHSYTSAIKRLADASRLLEVEESVSATHTTYEALKDLRKEHETAREQLLKAHKNLKIVTFGAFHIFTSFLKEHYTLYKQDKAEQEEYFASVKKEQEQQIKRSKELNKYSN